MNGKYLAPFGAAHSLGIRSEGLRAGTDGADLARGATSGGVASAVLQVLWKLPAKQQLRLALARTCKAAFSGNLAPCRYTIDNNKAQRRHRLPRRGVWSAGANLTVRGGAVSRSRTASRGTWAGPRGRPSSTGSGARLSVADALGRSIQAGAI